LDLNALFTGLSASTQAAPAAQSFEPDITPAGAPDATGGHAQDSGD